MTDPKSKNAPNLGTKIALRILQTTDLHGNLRGYDYLSDTPTETWGLAHTATLIHAARNAADNTLLFDSGDFIQGSPLCDHIFQRGLAQSEVHPVISVMNTLKYDGLTLGNHDFNYGLPAITAALSHANFAAVSANIAAISPNKPLKNITPHAIFTRNFIDTSGLAQTVKIGITGCLPPQTTDWDHTLAASLVTHDMVPAVRKQADILRQNGADIIIVLAHTGIGDAADTPRLENGCIPIAAIDDVDIVLCGHTHHTFPNAGFDGLANVDANAGLIHGKPVLMSGFWGNHLGQIDLDLEYSAGKWRIARSKSVVTPIFTRDETGQIVKHTNPDPEITEITQPAHDETIAHIRRPVGKSTGPLHSFFALVANDASVQLVTQAQLGFVRSALAKTPYRDLPLLSAAAPFKTGRHSGPDHYTHIPEGQLTRRNISDLYVYPNTICAVKTTGAQLRNWLEYSAGIFNALCENTPNQPLLNDQFPGYNFDTIQGLTYKIDLSQPPRYDEKSVLINPASHRIKSLFWNGVPVRADMEFAVACNTYRAYGNHFGNTANGQPRPEIIFEGKISSRDVVAKYISSQDNIPATCAKIWSFSPLKNTSAWFDTSPLAREYLSADNLPPMDDLGNTPGGFARMCITF